MKEFSYLFLLNIVRLTLATLSAEDPEPAVTYEGAQVWRTPLRTIDDISIFRRFMINEDISLWNVAKTRVDYLVQSKDRLRVHRDLEAHNLNHSVLIYDVTRRIRESQIKPEGWTDHSLRIGHRLNFRNYPGLTVIEEYFEFLKSNFESIVNIETIGYSVENRTIKLITISNGNPSNKKLLITAGHHAREWIGITSALYIANNIITKYDEQPDYVKDKDWYIVPLINPDGYLHTQTKDRLWRKNRRRHHNNPQCPGVDLNRNYPKYWQVAGVTTHNTCQEDYAGPFPLSEPETLTLLHFLDSLGPKTLSAYFDLHSYGQLLLYPWAGSKKASENRAYLEANAKAMSVVIQNSTGKLYRYGTPGEILYATSGAAIDWIHSKGVPLSYAVEARDLGAYGFLLPSDQIETTGKEMLGAVRAVAKHLNPKIMLRGGHRATSRWF